MNKIDSIIRKRKPPAIVIIDGTESVSYANREAVELLGGDGTTVPPETLRLSAELRQIGGREWSEAVGMTVQGTTCSVRGLLLEGTDRVMVLMERVVESHEIDLDKARMEFDLSKRETQVLQLVCKGMTNRDISEIMFISEYTVKDHMKNLLKKMEAGSRAEIISYFR